MKVTDVQCYPVYSGERNFLFVQVLTDEGISGIGESGLTWQELAVMGAVEQLKPLLIGRDPGDTEAIWQLVFRGSFFPGGKVLCSTLAAIDIALWDIQGKRFGVPVYRLLGGPVRDKVVCYPHNGGRTVQELVESCQRTVAAGWRFVRWGLGHHGTRFDAAEAVRRSIVEFEAVREAVGEQVELCFDVHTRLDPPDAVRLCREVERFRPYFVEDPLRSEEPYALRRLRMLTGAPLAVGEQFASKWEFREVVEEELTNYARIDVCIVGGLTEAKKIAGWCETHYIQLALHNPLGPVSTAACLHLDLASPLVGVQELPRVPGTILPDVFPVQVPFREGYLYPPERPGLGVEFDAEAAKAHPFQMVERPRLYRVDGAFTNW